MTPLLVSIALGAPLPPAICANELKHRAEVPRDAADAWCVDHASPRASAEGWRDAWKDPYTRQFLAQRVEPRSDGGLVVTVWEGPGGLTEASLVQLPVADTNQARRVRMVQAAVHVLELGVGDPWLATGVDLRWGGVACEAHPDCASAWSAAMEGGPNLDSTSGLRLDLDSRLVSYRWTVPVPASSISQCTPLGGRSGCVEGPRLAGQVTFESVLGPTPGALALSHLRRRGLLVTGLGLALAGGGTLATSGAVYWSWRDDGDRWSTLGKTGLKPLRSAEVAALTAIGVGASFVVTDRVFLDCLPRRRRGNFDRECH